MTITYKGPSENGTAAVFIREAQGSIPAGSIVFDRTELTCIANSMEQDKAKEGIYPADAARALAELTVEA